MSDPYAQTLYAPPPPETPRDVRETPRDDHATPRDGHATPRNDHATPRDGHATPRDGHATPRDGHATPRDGHATPREGHPTPRDAAPETSPVRESSGPPTPGRLVGGRYEIVGLLGAGGMGNVYRARDLELGETVALKMLRPEIVANPAALDRFRLEVKLARRVTHPHVARMFDIGEDGGERYLTMELIDGEPLSALIRREGRLPPERAATIARGVCEGLAAAHAAGVVHRDLKPDNVLVASDERPVVTDFGIAQAAGVDQARVTSGLVGTPAYMAPEQVEGKIAGPSADLYALGVMLHEMVTGELPWTGDSVFAVAAARLLHPPPDPLQRRPELPRELAHVIRTLMARSPDERYPSAVAAREALRTVPLTPPPAAAETSCKNLALPALVRCKKQVAVLPLRNAGPPEDDYVADGLTEDIIDQLSMADGLRVRSRGVVARYFRADVDPRELGRELAVQVVVDGTVRRTPAGVRVAVRLISVADGVQIWHRRFDRRLEDMLNVSDDAAVAIAEALAARLPAIERVPTDPKAIELYLRARSLYLRFFSDKDGESLKLFERARELAPHDPRILAGYAMAAARRWSRDPAAAPRARELAEAAVEQAPQLAESHVAFAVMCQEEQRVADAVRALKRALSLSRLNTEAHDQLGRILSETRLLEEARSHLEAALMAEPESELARVMLARVYMVQGRTEKVQELLLAHDAGEKALLPMVARYCLWFRDAGRARVTAAGLPKDGADLKFTRLILDVVGHKRAPWDELPPPGDGGGRFAAFLSQLAAEVAAFLGETDRALMFAERSAEAGLFDLAWMDNCPLFAGLRGDARWLAVRRRVEARAAEIEDAYREPIAPMVMAECSC